MKKLLVLSLFTLIISMSLDSLPNSKAYLSILKGKDEQHSLLAGCPCKNKTRRGKTQNPTTEEEKSQAEALEKKNERKI